MVALPVLATLDRKPRQGRKAATVLIDAGAEINRWGHLLLYALLLASSLFLVGVLCCQNAPICLFGELLNL